MANSQLASVISSIETEKLNSSPEALFQASHFMQKATQGSSICDRKKSNYCAPNSEIYIYIDKYISDRGKDCIVGSMKRKRLEENIIGTNKST